jgi:hypothetical protein
MMRRPQRATSAYHEAGHAAAAHALDFQIRDVSIKRTVRSEIHTETTIKRILTLGCVRLSVPQLDNLTIHQRSALLNNTIITHYAGPIAGRRYDPKAGWDQHSPEVSQELQDDWEKVRWCAQVLRLSGEEVGSRFTLAEAIVSAHWIGIETIAGELLKYRRLPGRVVHQVLADGKPVQLELPLFEESPCP